MTNREIKFRAFLLPAETMFHNMLSAKVGQIVDVSMIEWEPNPRITVRDEVDPCFIGWYWPLESCQLLQYTGLKDCNGKEIYEGDIVSYKTLGSFGESMDNMQGIVVFKDAMFAVLYDKEKGYEDCLCNCMKPVEIIGNIHENPELLEPNQ